MRPLLVLVVLVLTGWITLGRPAQEAAAARPDGPAFLARLAGSWDMNGRGRPRADVDFYRTASTMRAELRLDGSAVLREIDAPAIDMKAIDVLFVDPRTGECTYVYMSTNSKPWIGRGEMTGDDEVTFLFEEDSKVVSRTVISLDDEGVMMARDFRQEPDGSEWMSREVKHERTGP